MQYNGIFECVNWNDESGSKSAKGKTMMIMDDDEDVEAALDVYMDSKYPIKSIASRWYICFNLRRTLGDGKVKDETFETNQQGNMNVLYKLFVIHKE